MKRWKTAFSGKYVIVLLILIFLVAAAGVIMSFAESEKDDRTVVGIILPEQYADMIPAKDQHDGIMKACEAMNMKLIVRENKDILEIEKDVKALYEEGAGMIFLSTPFYVQAAVYIVGDYPDIAFSTSTPKKYARNMTGYFIRMFEGRYMAGVAAGLKTKTGVIGYYALKETGLVRGDINAFTLGVQAVNPDAKVVLILGNGMYDLSKMEKDVKAAVTKRNIDIITYQLDETVVEKVADELGIYYIGAFSPSGSKSPFHLFDVCISWEAYFKDMLNSYNKGELNYIHTHWTGMEADTVYLTEFAEGVTPEMINAVKEQRKRIDKGEFIFTGPIYDDKGVLRVEKDDVIPDSAMFTNMGWYVKGVERFEQ